VKLCLDTLIDWASRSPGRIRILSGCPNQTKCLPGSSDTDQSNIDAVPVQREKKKLNSLPVGLPWFINPKGIKLRDTENKCKPLRINNLISLLARMKRGFLFLL
jgi:hypothetical protein